MWCDVRLSRMGMNFLLTDSSSPYSRPPIIVVNLIMLVPWWVLMKLWCVRSKFWNLLREKTNLWGQTKCEIVKPFSFQQLWGQLIWFQYFVLLIYLLHTIVESHWLCICGLCYIYLRENSLCAIKKLLSHHHRKSVTPWYHNFSFLNSTTTAICFFFLTCR